MCSSLIELKRKLKIRKFFPQTIKEYLYSVKNLWNFPIKKD